MRNQTELYLKTVDANIAQSSVLPPLLKTPLNDNSLAELDDSIGFLAQHGISKRTLLRAQNVAAQNGTQAARELIAFRGIGEVDYYRLLAAHLNLEFVEASEISDVLLPRTKPAIIINKTSIIKGRVQGSAVKTIIVPQMRQIARLKKMSQSDEMRNQVVVTSPSMMRERLLAEIGHELVGDTANHLLLEQPTWSAKQGASAWQGATFALFIIFAASIFFANPNASSFAMHAVMSTFFLICVALRVFAFASYRPMRIAKIEPIPDRLKPVYSVMVPLYDEPAIVPDLIRALEKLKWPRSKLEIKIVCEQDDLATAKALSAIDLDSRFEVITVPAFGPSTKPNALCYALAFTNGKYITVYDAEDRPHPEQLLEAHLKFENTDRRLACVQAPLRTANPTRNLWTAMFHFEYASLFNGLLPWLARRKAPIMLGGTSNHFNGIG